MFKQLVPKSIKSYVRERHRRYVFERSVDEFAKRNENSTLSEALLRRLVYGWGNEGFSAETEYLSSVLDHAWKARGPILECGSGLSTVLLGVIAKKSDNKVWTLEHHPEWAERVRAVVKNLALNSVELCVAPLREFDQFSWYDAPLEEMPKNFELVVCDGPPGDTPGGRYGMLPLMRQFLSPGCTILLDDAGRDQEKAVATKWAHELGTDLRIDGTEKSFAVLTVP